MRLDAIWHWRIWEEAPWTSAFAIALFIVLIDVLRQLGVPGWLVLSLVSVALVPFIAAPTLDRAAGCLWAALAFALPVTIKLSFHPAGKILSLSNDTRLLTFIWVLGLYLSSIACIVSLVAWAARPHTDDR